MTDAAVECLLRRASKPLRDALFSGGGDSRRTAYDASKRPAMLAGPCRDCLKTCFSVEIEALFRIDCRKGILTLWQLL